MGKIKVGYKQTEIGIFPEDWQLICLSEAGKVYSGGTPDTMNSHYWDGDIFWCTPTDITALNGKKYLYDTNRKITDLGLKFSSSKLLPPDSVIVCTRATIGKTVINKVPVSTNQGFKNIVPININPDLLYYIICDNADRLIKLASGSTFLEVSKNGFDNFPIVIPPLKEEQEEIVKVLSDIDLLIEELINLIDKKRAIKEGVMQQLLFPKEKWIKKDLKQICWFQEGPGLRNWQFTKNGIKVINVTNLENGYLNLNKTDRYISWKEFKKMYQHFEIDENDIVIASSGNSYGKVSIVRKNDLPLLMNTSVIRFKPINNTDYNFLLMYLKSYFFKKQLNLLTTGGAQPNFGPYHLNQITLFVPDNSTEQKEIGDTLKLVEDEIELLELTLLKYKDIKTGMLQQLLTGKIRLI